MKKILIPLLLILSAVAGGCFAYLKYGVNNDSNSNAANASANDEEVISVMMPASPVMCEPTVAIIDDLLQKHATITCIGDIMMHEWQITRGYDEASDTFDYSDIFTYITPYLNSADYTVGNLETTLAGRYNGNSSGVLGYASYPCFNSPEVLANNLQDAGVDLVCTANNHSYDSGINGVYATIDYLDSIGMEHVGTYKSQADKETLKIVDINGIKVGFCAYTYDLNGFVLPSDALYSVNTLNNYSDEKIQEMCNEIRALREAGCDLVVPMLHLGLEYVSMPSSWHEMVCDKAFEAGADIIFAGHPHVVEPLDIRDVDNGDGTTRKGVVIYSMGNFVSSQKFKEGAEKDVGVIIDVDVTKNSEGVTLDEVRIAPEYVYWTDETIGVVPVVEAYNNRDNYSFLSSYDWSRIESTYNTTINTITSYSNPAYTLGDDNKYHFDVNNN